MKTPVFIVIIIATFCFSPSVLFAQKDAKAKGFLDKSSDTFARSGALSVVFTMNIKDIQNEVSQAFDGTIDVKDKKFHIDTPDMETWFDGKTQWVLQKEWDEVNITEPNALEVQALNPTTIFSIYKKGCNYSYKGEKIDAKGRKVQEVELIPQAKNSEITKIVMQISSTDFMPAKIHLFYKNKIENIIHINNYQKNTGLTDKKFVFDKKDHPNAEIIDLR
ncbi:membrane protein [Bacteroidia bacterium]|nr:membrane protein [Bacteroidia bacterium]